MTQEVNRKKLSSTQAGGAVAVIPAISTAFRASWYHTVQAVVTVTATGVVATPAAGTLSVRGKIAGAPTYQELGVINLVAPIPIIFEGFYDSLEAVSTGLDGDKTWTLYIVNGG
jgi:hypothetical protein